MRLIDADALCKLANNNITKSVDANDIMRFPTVDATPVRHGHWIYKWNLYFRQEIPYCSVCEKASSSVSKTDYCPHCGAKMDESTQSNDSNVLDALGEKVTE